MLLNHNNNDKEVFRNTEKDNTNTNINTNTRTYSLSYNNINMLKIVLTSIQQFIKHWFVVILAVIAPIAYLVYYNATHFTVIIEKDHLSMSPNNPSGMTDIVAAIIVTGLASLMALIFNPILAKKYDAIKAVIDNNIKANEIQHAEITVILKDHGKMFNSMLTVRDVRSCISTIVSNALVYSEDRKLSEWIATEGKLFITFCDDTLSTGLSKINYKSFKTDVDVMITASNINTKDYLGDVFLKLIVKEHTDRMIGFRNDVLAITSDKLMNSKIDRFRAKSEIFLQEYLASTIITYNKFNK